MPYQSTWGDDFHPKMHEINPHVATPADDRLMHADGISAGYGAPCRQCGDMVYLVRRPDKRDRWEHPRFVTMPDGTKRRTALIADEEGTSGISTHR